MAKHITFNVTLNLQEIQQIKRGLLALKAPAILQPVHIGLVRKVNHICVAAQAAEGELYFTKQVNND